MLESILGNFKTSSPVVIPAPKRSLSTGWSNLAPVELPKDSLEEHIEWAKMQKPLRFAHRKPICECGSYTVIERIDNLELNPNVIAVCGECNGSLPLNLRD